MFILNKSNSKIIAQWNYVKLPKTIKAGSNSPYTINWNTSFRNTTYMVLACPIEATAFIIGIALDGTNSIYSKSSSSCILQAANKNSSNTATCIGIYYLGIGTYS